MVSSLFSLSVSVHVCCSIVVNRVATFKELDTDLIRHTGFLCLVSNT